MAIPPGSAAIEDVFEQYYTLVGEPYDDTEFSGRSDYQAFIENGIPSGGLFTGAEEEKTAAAAGDLGRHDRRAARPVLPPRVRHVRQQQRPRARRQQRRVAFAVLTFAYSTESVNGVKGKDVPGSRLTVITPNGPEGTFTP